MALDEEVEVISVDLTGLSSESATGGRKLDGLSPNVGESGDR